MNKNSYHGMSPQIYSRAFAKYNIGFFLVIMVLFGVLSFVLPKNGYSEMEKRELATLPKFSAESFVSGDYMQNLSKYYSDNFPGRDFLVAFADQIKEASGVRYDDVKIHQGTTPPPEVELPSSSMAPSIAPEIPPEPDASNGVVVPPEPTESSSTSISEEPSSSEPEIDDGAVGEQQGSTFIYKGRGMGMFGANFDMGTWYAQTLNKYHEILGSDVQIYNMIVPTSIDFYLPEKYKHITQPQKPAIDHIYLNLNPEIKTVNAYGALEKNKKEYIYFNTDHHWTGLGAYYAYVEFAKVAGFDPVPLENFEVRRLENFLGTLYGQTKDQALRDNPDYVDYFMIDTPHVATRYIKNEPYTGYVSSLHGEYAKSPNSYSVFLHGDFPMLKVVTENKNGKKIAVVKESYGNAFAPFLVNHYEEVYIIDERYFQLGFINFIKENGINELAFVNNSMAAFTPYHIKNLENIMYQSFVPPVAKPDPASVAPEKPSSSEEPSDQPTEEEED